MKEGEHGSATERFFRNLPRSKVAIALFVFLLRLALTFYSSGVMPASGDCSLSQAPHTNFLEKILYAPLMDHKFSAEPWPQVVVVTIDPEVEPLSVMNNVCEGRLFLSALVSQLDRAGASVVAIDKFFSRDACREEDKNAVFRSALTHTRAKIVVGEAAHHRAKSTTEEDCLVLTDPYDFESSTTGLPGTATETSSRLTVTRALTRLNQNSLKIPLRWWVFSSDDAAGNLHDPADKAVNGFALEAAEEMDPQMKYRESLRNLIEKNEHPFSSFVDSSKLPVMSALDVLCSGSDPDVVKANEWGDCSRLERKPISLKQKLIVVGELSEQDRVSFPGKEEYGVFLQANYAGSLLDERYVHGIGAPTEYVILAIFFLISVFLDVQTAREKMTPKMAAVWAMVALEILLIVGIVLLYAYRIFAPTLFLTVWGFVLTLVQTFLGLKFTDAVSRKSKGVS